MRIWFVVSLHLVLFILWKYFTLILINLLLPIFFFISEFNLTLSLIKLNRFTEFEEPSWVLAKVGDVALFAYIMENVESEKLIDKIDYRKLVSISKKQGNKSISEYLQSLKQAVESDRQLLNLLRQGLTLEEARNFKFRCNFCDKSFNHSSVLKRHKKSHTIWNRHVIFSEFVSQRLTVLYQFYNVLYSFILIQCTTINAHFYNSLLSL